MNTLEPVTYGYSAVLEAHELANSGDAVPFRMTLNRGRGEFPAFTWLPPTPMDDVRIRKVHVTLVDVLTDDFVACSVVTDLIDTPSAPVLPLIAVRCDDDPLIVQRFRDVVKSIEAIPLVNFINDVFTLRQVYRHFWTCPASQSHHHPFRGGLAEHSIEMAERVASTPHASPTKWDLAIVYALFHDIGKIWCYGTDGFTPYQDLGHELAGLAALNDALTELHNHWPDGAIALRSLLAGVWKVKGGRPILAIGKIVQAFDQESAEQDLRRRKGHRYEPWTAKPYSNNAQEF